LSSCPAVVQVASFEKVTKEETHTTLNTRDSMHFKQGATVSYDVNEAALNSGNNFLVTAKLSYAQAQCDCNLDITFTESVSLEKVGVPNIPIQQSAADTDNRKKTAVPKEAPKRGPISGITE